MKRCFAVILAIVLTLTLIGTAACKSSVVRVVLNVTNDDVRVCKHQIGKDDLPSVSNGDKEFDGWYLDKDYLSPFKYSAEIQDGTRLYAKWKDVNDTPAVSKITVTFIPNYEGASITTQSIDKGSTLSLAVLQRNGFTFDGWFTQPVGGNKWADNLPFSVDTMLYAHWTATSPSGGDDSKGDDTPTVQQVVVTFNPNFDGSASTMQRVNKGGSLTLPTTMIRNGFTFNGWFTQPSGGTQWTNSTPFNADTVLYAHWTANSSSGGDNTGDDTPSAHTHNFGDSYFIYVKCSTPGCDVMGRAASSNPFRNDFTYSYTQQDRNSMDSLYTSLDSKVKAGKVGVDEITNGVKQFEALLDDIEYQYQVATVMYSVNYNDEWEQKATLIGNAYNDWFKDYYTLLAAINSSSYGSAYFSDWSQEDKEYVLEMAQVYSSSEDNLATIADDLATEYNRLLSSSTATLQDLYEAYGKYVKANNNIAAQYGSKYSNYMDYAYENDYNREYTPADVASMREYVRKTVAPILTEIYGKLNGISSMDSVNENFYDSLSLTSLFTVDEGYENSLYAATQYIGNYFKYLNSNEYVKQIDFYKQVNDLFKNGNYFTSTNGEEGAYTYWIVDKKQSVMYFDDQFYVDEEDEEYGQYYYSTAFTFIHEFGHYYNGVYNGSMALSMDHDETQSQGNEMLFLAWLSENLPAGVSSGYQVLKYMQLANILQTIVQSTIVDEFEQAVYSNTYGNGEFKNGIAPADYGELYNTIVESYGSGMSQILGSTYWLGVVVNSPAYYISYAMSALPSLEIFVKAMKEGLNAARESFFKLYAFSDQSSLVNDYSYRQVLTYAGLDSPFDEQMYTTIAAYFSN